MAQTPPFEIPQQLREMAEKNVEHARAAYGQFMDAVTQAMGMWASATPPNAVTTSFKVVQDRAVKFAKQNAEACFNLASDLASAKDITDVLSIQSRHAQTQMQSYSLQAQELSRLMMEATAQTMQPKN
jgi:phasin